MCGLRKLVTDAKEGHLEVRKKKGRENAPAGRRWGKAPHPAPKQREGVPWGKEGEKRWGKALACLRGRKRVP